MESEDDLNPLINGEGEVRRRLSLGLFSQKITLDPELDEVVEGYRESRCRKWLVYVVSCMFAGLPFLVFHWVPTWLLYLTSTRCHFTAADKVLVTETYQKKCKNYYIHKILHKDLEDSSGYLNEGFDVDSVVTKVATNEDNTIPIPLEDGTTLKSQSFRYFRHKKCTLIWEEGSGAWRRGGGAESGATCASLRHRAATPPSPLARARALNLYGHNEIKVPVQSIPTLILLEVFNPFYVFQVFTICVWLAEPYYYYCVAVVIMSTFGVATSVIQTKRNQESLRATVESHSLVDVVVEGRVQSVDSRCVCPGDIVALPAHASKLYFDAVLLDGQAIVNEAMLTGESVPVTKSPLPPTQQAYDVAAHSAHTLFCGTTVIQTKYYTGDRATALVLRTGYSTSKGQLVRSILYPIPADFKFDRDSYKFIGILAVIAMLGLSYTVALKWYRGLTPRDIIIKALDIITIVIPPALPAAMTVGRLYAASRLAKGRISTLNTRAVCVSGRIDCLALDKTGTLTEEGLDMWGVVTSSSAYSPPLLKEPVRDPRKLDDLDDMKLGMATCHTLTLLNGVLDGDPLELKMFESTGWSLEEPEVPSQATIDSFVPVVVKPKRHTNINVDDFHVPLEVGVVKQNQFLSSLQRSSVVVRVLGENVSRVYCKGAPEMLRTLCRKETVPSNLTEVLSGYAEKGYRVIAMSTRIVEAGNTELQTMTREQLECELDFVGLVIMENRLKPATAGVIREIKDANIHVVMVTGDNIHTAVSVAKECHILESGERVVYLQADTSGPVPLLFVENSVQGVPLGSRHSARLPAGLQSAVDSGHGSDTESAKTGEPDYRLVMTGDTWAVLRDHYPDSVGPVLTRTAVLARMSPEQKQQLVVEYMALGYYVGMCGDGANDCGALRAAHTGISLSEFESSVAAPFTSQDPDIVCVTRVLREGRAALTTSFGVFKFMIAYSLTEFFSVAFLYYFDANLTDFQFLFIDVALIVNFAFFFGKTEAYTGRLCKIPPLTSLLGLIPLLSLVGQMALVMVAQYLSYYAVKSFPWYVRHTYQGEEANKCWENYAIYTVSMFQYIILTIAFSHGSPYRRSVITNKQLMLSVLIMTVISVYITVAPAEWIADFLQLEMPLDILMCYIVLVIAAIHFVVALFFERVLIQYCMEEKQYLPKCVKERRVNKTPHLLIKRHLSSSDYLVAEDIIQYESDCNGFSDSNNTMKGR